MWFKASIAVLCVMLISPASVAAAEYKKDEFGHWMAIEPFAGRVPSRYRLEQHRDVMVRLFTDPETGCEYFIFENNIALPRMMVKGGSVVQKCGQGE